MIQLKTLIKEDYHSGEINKIKQDILSGLKQSSDSISLLYNKIGTRHSEVQLEDCISKIRLIEKLIKTIGN